MHVAAARSPLDRPLHWTPMPGAALLVWTSVMALLPLAAVAYLFVDLVAPRAAVPAVPTLDLFERMAAAVALGLVLLGFDWMGQAAQAPDDSAFRRWASRVLGATLAAGAAGLMLAPRPSDAALEWLQAAFVGLVILYLTGAALIRAARVRDARVPARPWPQVARDLLAMSKPGLNGLVLFSTGFAYCLASPRPIDWRQGLLALVGTGLVASGATMLNQYMERETDAVMARTAGRPLPARRLTPGAALNLGVLLASAGLWLLASEVRMLTAFLGALTLGSYLFLYTPLKRLHPLSTLAGAVSGALPPLMGWTAAGGSIGPLPLALFFIQFFWQVPHFLAIAWKYRDQYRAAGCPIVAVVDADGAATARLMMLYTIALMAVSLIPWVAGRCSPWYAGIAVLLGAAFAAAGWRFLIRRDAAGATLVFVASIVYLPMLFAGMLGDVLVTSLIRLG